MCSKATVLFLAVLLINYGETLSYTKSNVKFLASELTFKNTTFEIDKSLGVYFVKDNISFLSFRI